MRGMPQRVEDSLLGLAAGMMLAVSAFSLLLPELDAATDILGNRTLGADLPLGVPVTVAIAIALQDIPKGLYVYNQRVSDGDRQQSFVCQGAPEAAFRLGLILALHYALFWP